MMTNLLHGAHVANKLFSTIARLRLLLVMFVALSVSVNAWGATATLTLSSSKKFGTTSGSTLTDDQNNTWTCNGSNIQNTYNTTYKGQQFGTSKNAGNYTFACTIAGATISSVKITAAAGSTNAKYSISVGGSSKYSGNLSKTSTTYGGTNASGSGEISISLQGSGTSAAVYLGSITVVYTTASATKHTVTFNAGSNGTCSTPSLTEASAGAGVTLPNVTPNSGYRFLGWATTSAATTADAGKAGENYKPSSNITLYAIYVQQYTIQWYADGTLLEAKTYDKGSPIQAPTVSVTPCEGMQHVGWTTISDYTHATEAPSSFIDEDTPLGNATFNMKFYALFAKVEGPTETPTTLTETIKFTNFSSGTSTRTYESISANWTWKKNDGSSIAEYDEIRLYAKHSMTIAPKTGCTVSNIIATCTSGSYATALGGGSLDGATKTVSGSTVTITPTSGNIVITQKDQSRVSQFTVTFTTNVASGGKITNYTTTCTAKPTVFTITYEANGGTTIEQATNVTALPNPLPTTRRDHYTFAGWFTDEDCTQAAEAGATIDADITLYAKWTAKTYTITLDANGGTFVDNRDSQTKGSAKFDYIYGTYATYSDAPNLTEYYTDLKRDGYQFDGWVSAGSPWNKLFTSTGDRTIQAQWTKLHTITWKVNGEEYTEGTPTTSVEDGNAITHLPTAPSAPSGCSEKVFVGWTNSEISEETDIKPATLFTDDASAPAIDGDKTFHAVFATVAGGGVENLDATLSFANTAQRTSLSTSQQVWEQNGIILTNEKGSSTTNVADYANPARFYKNSNITITAPGNITKIVFNCSENDYTYTIGDNSEKSGTIVTTTLDGSKSSFTAQLSSGQVRMNSLTVTYSTTGGTSYSDYSTVCEAIPDPVWGGAVINRNSIKVDCGSMTKLNAADPNGPATISFPAATNHTLTYDITVTASEGFLVSTNKTDAAKYGASVTVSPNKTGDNAGKITQNVYVVAVAPAMSDEDFTGTITLSGKQLAENQVIDVTADVTCTTYTLTLNDRGTKTTAEYYAGASVPKPEDPTGVCTDPIHYVFDGWAAATVAEGSTTYTKVTFPYSMPAKNTTLHAVYRYVDENAEFDKFMSVDKGIGELVSGMDYVLTGYNTDDKEYALSCTQYESGKYKTKQIDVSESTTMYDEENPYYELTTTDNEIIWTITGDDENGYSFQNKSTGKYLNMEESSLVLNDNNPTKYTIDHYEAYDNELGDYVTYLNMIIQPLEDYSYYLSSYYKNSTAGVLFNLHSSSTLQLYLYKRATSYLYTTSPACGPMLEITSGKDIYVTSGYGTGRNTVIAQQTVEYRATRLKTQNGSAEGKAPDVKVAANGITVGGVVTNNVKVVKLTQNKELIGDKYTITGTVTVQYTPTANDLQEDIQVQLAVDYNTDAKDNFTVHARSLPSEFVIAAKQGDKWYALNADMSGSDAEKANGYLQVDDIEDPTKATFAPCNTIYTFDGMVDGGNKEYMRFQGIDGKYLWAASAGNTGIQNYAKNTPTAGTIAYNWQLYTNDNETYQLQNEGNERTLGLSKDLNFGMYSYVSTLQQDIRILPYEAKCLYNYAPTNLKVSVLKSTSVTLTWDAVAGATKYQYSTDATNWNDAGTEPTVTINGLTRGTEYIYYVRAYHEDAGVSQECIDYAKITFTTANCDDVPTDITYTADLNSITVSWTAAAPTATIKLFMNEDGTGGGGTYPGATSPYKISGGLKKNTTYYIQIFSDGTCASPIVPVKTEDVKVDVVEWKTDGIIVDINTDETVGVTLENEVSYGSGSGSLAEDLFFSKYFEGSGSLKMLAIYNGTGKDVNLSEYRIDRGSNGDATNISKTYDLSQLGVIKQGQEIIFYSWPLTSEDSYSCSQSFLDSKAQESGLDANPRWILCDAKTHSGIEFEAMDFSGDDPLLFYKGNTLIDVFGVSTAAERPSKKTLCDGRSDNSWSADEVTNMDYGKTKEDFPNGEIPYGVNVDDKTITAYTARVIMFRKNTVVSGKNAVTKNTTTFATFADEWEARQVCRSGDDGDLTCAAYQELGTFDYSDYYTKFVPMGEGSTFDENARNADGTVTIPITDLYKHACSNIRVKLTNSNGDVLTDREYKVPIMITTTQGTDGQAFLALQENLATVEVDDSGNPTGNKTKLTLEQVREICKTCDVVVRDNAILTKADDDADDDHPEVRDVYVYQNSSLIVPAGTNYTINNLSLRRKEDAVASVSAYPDALKLPESAAAPITLDFRLSAESWHWFTLPFDCNISEVTWVDGSPAQYNVDWFLMTYDGKKRAETQAGGCWKAYTGTTIKAGEGFILAINGNINNPAHTYELRFPMSKEVLAAEGTDKTVAVRAWGVETNIRPNHKGWNLVGNPYLAYYQRNNITNFEGLRLGQLTGPDLQTGYWEQTGDVPYVVVPVGAGWIAYEQVLASETDLLPFTAYFVQVGNDGKHDSSDELSISFDHTKLQLSATPMPAFIIQRSASIVEEPVIVGVSLTNAKGESDKTSLIIDDQFTDEYEMNADFFKWFGDYYKYYTKPVVYTVGADQGKRAFNAISEDLASQPISLGMFAAQTGNYTFSLDLRSDLSKVQEVWLYDATQDVYTNLLQDDYTFHTAKTESAGRFFLSVKMAPKVTTDTENLTSGSIWATTHNKTITINGLLSNSNVWVYDATGKLLHADHTTNYQHSYSVPTSGVYFVRVNGKTEAQTIKIVVE